MNTAFKSFKSLLQVLLLSLMFCGAAFANEKVNINTADAAALARVLHNVGPSKAEAIVQHRIEHGPFRSAEQLAQVKGIGLKTVERNADRIIVDANPPATRHVSGQPRGQAERIARNP